METWTETHRSFVNTWECDENDHLNVQFYLGHFDEAARIFTRNNDDSYRLPKSRHVRFHRELRPGAMTRIVSGIVADGAFAGWIVHRLEDAGLDHVAATALDAPADGMQLGGISWQDAEIALPRGLPDGHLSYQTASEILDQRGLISYRSILMPAECDDSGHMLEQHYVSRFTNAAPHVWESAGIGERFLNEKGFGRVAVEMKITHHQPASAGDAVFVYSRSELTGQKTIKIRHEVVNETDKTAIASAEVLALILDLKTRRSVPLPPDLRE